MNGMITLVDYSTSSPKNQQPNSNSFDEETPTSDSKNQEPDTATITEPTENPKSASSQVTTGRPKFLGRSFSIPEERVVPGGQGWVAKVVRMIEEQKSPSVEISPPDSVHQLKPKAEGRWLSPNLQYVKLPVAGDLCKGVLQVYKSPPSQNSSEQFKDSQITDTDSPGKSSPSMETFLKCKVESRKTKSSLTELSKASEPHSLQPASVIQLLKNSMILSKSPPKIVSPPRADSWSPKRWYPKKDSSSSKTSSPSAVHVLKPDPSSEITHSPPMVQVVISNENYQSSTKLVSPTGSDSWSPKRWYQARVRSASPKKESHTLELYPELPKTKSPPSTDSWSPKRWYQRRSNSSPPKMGSPPVTQDKNGRNSHTGTPKSKTILSTESWCPRSWYQRWNGDRKQDYPGDSKPVQDQGWLKREIPAFQNRLIRGYPRQKYYPYVPRTDKMYLRTSDSTSYIEPETHRSRSPIKHSASFSSPSKSPEAKKKPNFFPALVSKTKSLLEMGRSPPKNLKNPPVKDDVSSPSRSRHWFEAEYLNTPLIRRSGKVTKNESTVPTPKPENIRTTDYFGIDFDYPTVEDNSEKNSVVGNISFDSLEDYVGIKESKAADIRLDSPAVEELRKDEESTDKFHVQEKEDQYNDEKNNKETESLTKISRDMSFVLDDYVSAFDKTIKKGSWISRWSSSKKTRTNVSRNQETELKTVGEEAGGEEDVPKKDERKKKVKKGDLEVVERAGKKDGKKEVEIEQGKQVEKKRKGGKHVCKKVDKIREKKDDLDKKDDENDEMDASVRKNSVRRKHRSQL